MTKEKFIWLGKDLRKKGEISYRKLGLGLRHLVDLDLLIKEVVLQKSAS